MFGNYFNAIVCCFKNSFISTPSIPCTRSLKILTSDSNGVIKLFSFSTSESSFVNALKNPNMKCEDGIKRQRKILKLYNSTEHDLFKIAWTINEII